MIAPSDAMEPHGLLVIVDITQDRVAIGSLRSDNDNIIGMVDT
jgi:hypothetical protein